MSDEKKNAGRKPKEKTDSYNSLFASRLRLLLESSETTQVSLAEQLNSTRQSIGNWTLGKSQPDFDTLVKIADLFNTSTDYLLGRTDARTNNQEIRSICDYTGLSEENVILLMGLFSKSENNSINSRELDFLNFCLSSKEFWDSAFEAVNCQKQKHFVIEEIENKKKLPEIEYNSPKIMMYTAITRFSDLVKRYTEVKDFEKIVSDYIYHYKSEGGEE